MPALGFPSLDQLRTFLCVVETGSFSAAARRLNRRQSVVSYTIAKLEDELGGLLLFDRATRRPTLTEAGRAMLSEARKVSHGADGLKARAAGLLAGLEPELSVSVDVMLPRTRLVATLVAFREAFPTVSLRLSIEAIGRRGAARPRRGLRGRRQLAAHAAAIDGIEQRPLGSVKMLPVAAPGHPLGARPGPGVDRRPPRPRATGPDRPIRSHEGPRLQRLRHRDLATRRPRSEARPADRRPRLGRDARRHGRGRPRGWTASRGSISKVTCRTTTDCSASTAPTRRRGRPGAGFSTGWLSEPPPETGRRDQPGVRLGHEPLQPRLRRAAHVARARCPRSSCGS